MKADLIINKIEIKKTKTGNDYAVLSTDRGAVTSFDKDIIAALKQGTISCELEEKNGYTSIKKLYDEAVSSPNAVAAPDKSATMIMSYVKDLVQSGHIDLNDFEMWCAKLMAIYRRL
jgi:hypothetical protein